MPDLLAPPTNATSTTRLSQSLPVCHHDARAVTTTDGNQKSRKPDSFSGDGLLRQADVIAAAVAQAQAFAAAGADILDIGGQSTRPGSVPVSPEVELARILPALHIDKNTKYH